MTLPPNTVRSRIEAGFSKLPPRVRDSFFQRAVIAHSVDRDGVNGILTKHFSPEDHDEVIRQHDLFIAEEEVRLIKLVLPELNAILDMLLVTFGPDLTVQCIPDAIMRNLQIEFSPVQKTILDKHLNEWVAANLAPSPTNSEASPSPTHETPRTVQ